MDTFGAEKANYVTIQYPFNVFHLKFRANLYSYDIILNKYWKLTLDMK